MKKILLACLLVLIGVSAANAALDVTMTKIDSGHTFIVVQVDTVNGNPPDSAMNKWTLVCAQVNPPTVHLDSITSGHTFPDTLRADGLQEGQQYWFMVISQDSVTTDTTAVDSITTTNLTQTLTFPAAGVTASQCSLHITYANADSGLKKHVLLWGTSINPTTHKDSLTTGLASPNAFVITGLTHNQTYYARTLAIDSAFTDTSSNATVTLEGIVLTITVDDTTYRDFTVRIEVANEDSALKKLVLYKCNYPECLAYSKADSSISINNDDDSLYAAPAPADLTANSQYTFFVVATDSTGTDTSAVPVDTITTDQFYWFTYNQGIGGIETNLFHYTWSFDESQDSFVTIDFSVSNYRSARISAKLLNVENNHTFDSLQLTTYAVSAFGEVAAIDTVITVDADTGTYTAEYLFPTTTVEDSVYQNRLGHRAWGEKFRFKATVTDSTEAVGDTMDCDTRYLDLWIRLEPRK